MDTSGRPNRHWDVAPLLLLGVVLGLVGSRVESAVGAVVSLAGLVLLLVALARWTRRSRPAGADVVPVEAEAPRFV